jgi:hypothetical protein
MLLPLASALIVSVISSYITVRLSMRQFFSERLWEKRAEAYSSIMGHLAWLQYTLGEWSEEIINPNVNWNKEKRDHINEMYSKAKEEVTKVAAIGSYVISEEAASSLEELLKELNKDYGNDIYKENDNNYAAVKKCISLIRKDSKKVLSSR